MPQAGIASLPSEPEPVETADLGQEGFGRCFYDDLELNDATQGQDEEGDREA